MEKKNRRSTRAINVFWTKNYNMLKVRCACGTIYNARIDRLRGRCRCGLGCYIPLLRTNYVRRFNKIYRRKIKEKGDESSY